MSFGGQRVLLKTPLATGSGYGRDGIDVAMRLEDIGADVHLEPTFVNVPLPPQVANMFTKPRPERFEVAITHIDPQQLAVSFKEGITRASDIVVGWTMWEFLSFGNQEFIQALRNQIELMDVVLAYDEVSASALRPLMDEPERLKILQGGYDSDYWEPKEEDTLRSWDGTFKFAMNGTMNQRKNPFASINAFQKLKEEHGDDFDAELHMKTTSMVLHPAIQQWMPGIKIYYEGWSPAKLRQFYFGINCLLAPSWGEGKNLPALEAQTSGCPVMVSEFGGHMQWADPQWSYLIPGTVTDKRVPGMPYLEVDEDKLAELMWHVYTHREEAKLKGEIAARVIPQQCDWARVIEKLGHILDEVKPRTRST